MSPAAPTRKRVDVAAAVLLARDGDGGYRFLLGQRAPDTFYPGYWEFPGGKVEVGETPRQALLRELEEELAIEVLAADPWIVLEHEYEHAHVRLHFFRVRAWHGTLRDRVHSALSWQPLDAPQLGPMLPANGPVLKSLRLPDLMALTDGGALGLQGQLDALKALLCRHAGAPPLLQLREADPVLRDALREPMRTTCRQAGALLLENCANEARIDEALRLQADGIHLKSALLMRLDTRPAAAWVGASCHDRTQLDRAIALGLDYAVLGPVSPTPSHPEQPGMGWDTFTQAIADCPLPVYAIGGMQIGTMTQAWARGAHGIACLSAAWR